MTNAPNRRPPCRCQPDGLRVILNESGIAPEKLYFPTVAYSRNKEWESIFDRLIELREKDGIPLGLMIQVDTLCHKIPNFMEKGGRCYRTGEHQPGQSGGGEKAPEQNHRISLLAWKEQGILTIAGYILGFPADTPKTIRRDIANPG